jgi:PAN domain-containing protein/TIR domain-containing protein
VAGKIFISYRRDDTRADARSIYQRLQRTFGAKKLFMDVDTIERGRDFRSAIDAYLANSAAMLVLIGRNWLGTSAETSVRRINDPADFVSVEISTALRRDIAVIPVLVDGAQMPQSQDLPAEIRPLAFRQAARITHENFSTDMERLERDLMVITGLRRRWKLLAPAGVALLAVLGIAAYRLMGPNWVTQPAEDPNQVVKQTGDRQEDPAARVVTERAFTSFEANTDRPGGDYTSHRLSEADAILCQKLCAEDQRCLAWTYVAPGYQEANAVCWLKNIVPSGTRQDACCTSGVAYYRRPAN